MSIQGVGEFLSHFNCNSYNRTQIGNDKQLVIRIYEYLDKIKLSDEDKELVISNISYLKNDIDIPLFLEILSKSLGYTEEYSLSKVIKVCKEVHNTYIDCINEISMEDYIHLTNDSRLKKIFIPNRNKLYNEQYLNDLRFASAIKLNNKEYTEFLSLLESNSKTLLVFNKYLILRNTLNEEVRLYWDIIFGLEYILVLNKINIPYEDIFKKSNKVTISKPKELENPIQLDIFNYEEPTSIALANISIFQIDIIYKTDNIPDIDKETELLDYYNNIVKRNKYITLPKLRGKQSNKYIFVNK